MNGRHRGLVKWYDRGLQNLWWEFDSLVPCDEVPGKPLIYWLSGFFYFETSEK